MLGSILFTLYMLLLGNIIDRHGINFYCYSNDSQLYLPLKPENMELSARLQACLKHIEEWMTSNIVLLNLDKTEVIVCGT